ncbi:hypothetical protein Tco_0757650 [Tanacetum coccineum]
MDSHEYLRKKRISPVRDEMEELNRYIELGKILGYDVTSAQKDRTEMIGRNVQLVVVRTTLDMECTMINVYAPQDINLKRALWNDLADIVNRTSGEAFNGFIDHSELIDILMGGKNFSDADR